MAEEEGRRAEQAGDDGAIDYLQNNKLLEVRERAKREGGGRSAIKLIFPSFSGDIPSSAKSSRPRAHESSAFEELIEKLKGF